MASRHTACRNRRSRVPARVADEVLTESGYRCAVPTCRGILAVDLHHLVPVRDGGPNTAANLIALCPTCHALHERGTIPHASVATWKRYLQSLSRGYDHSTLDLLWFLKRTPGFQCSGDGVVSFARLIGTGLAELSVGQNGFGALVGVALSERGTELLNAWTEADGAYLSQPRSSIRTR